MKITAQDKSEGLRGRKVPVGKLFRILGDRDGRRLTWATTPLTLVAVSSTNSELFTYRAGEKDHEEALVAEVELYDGVISLQND